VPLAAIAFNAACEYFAISMYIAMMDTLSLLLFGA
jgi:hypothetical protein